jgi:hypothetical protein
LQLPGEQVELDQRLESNPSGITTIVLTALLAAFDAASLAAFIAAFLGVLVGVALFLDRWCGIIRLRRLPRHSLAQKLAAGADCLHA